MEFWTSSVDFARLAHLYPYLDYYYFKGVFQRGFVTTMKRKCSYYGQ